MTQETQRIRNVTKNFGTRATDMQFGGRVDNENLVKTASWSFDFGDLPIAALHNLGLSIPAGSTLVSAKMRVLTAFTSISTTTDLTVGLAQADGTVIDADGLITAIEATQTVIATSGNLVIGAGALLGVSIGAAAGELVVTPTVDDLLTGRGEIIVEYMTPAALPV